MNKNQDSLANFIELAKKYGIGTNGSRKQIAERLSSSRGVYLSKNEKAPLSSVENRIRNIVFNQRKLDFLKKFDQEIINDAIQNKKFEIYQ